MPILVAEALRYQARDCLRVAQQTSDPRVKEELLSAAAWLHEEAIKIEKLLASSRGGGPTSTPPGGPASTPPKGNRRALPAPRSSPRYQRLAI